MSQMADYFVLLVEPKIEGNVGAVARSMMNFGLKELGLVNPCEIGDVAEKRAMKAIDILKEARKFDSLEEALEDVDFVVGTSGVETHGERRFIRIALDPEEASNKLSEVNGKVALLFGREDFGLLNEELTRCDMLLRIPSSEEYPILNISHAANIVFYELFKHKTLKEKPRKASGFEKEKLHEHFERLLDAINYPEHKRERTKMMFRRWVGRATPSKWEFHAMMGVISSAADRLLKSKND
ncbi:MAG: RNA methyltransferase [Methanobacteriota archaeon]|nr:MAG: RNA methyltransferase [Euryarchaeota archaeon]